MHTRANFKQLFPPLFILGTYVGGGKKKKSCEKIDLDISKQPLSVTAGHRDPVSKVCWLVFSFWRRFWGRYPKGTISERLQERNECTSSIGNFWKIRTFVISSVVVLFLSGKPACRCFYCISKGAFFRFCPIRESDSWRYCGGKMLYKFPCARKRKTYIWPFNDSIVFLVACIRILFW